MLGWLFGSSQAEADYTALRIAFLHHECDLSDGMPTEADFLAWLETLDSDDIDFYNSLGECALARSGHDDNGDLFDALDLGELRPFVNGVQKASSSWGLVSNLARVYAWLHGFWGI